MGFLILLFWKRPRPVTGTLALFREQMQRWPGQGRHHEATSVAQGKAVFGLVLAIQRPNNQTRGAFIKLLLKTSYTGRK
jgi:hypothetical protein